MGCSWTKHRGCPHQHSSYLAAQTSFNAIEVEYLSLLFKKLSSLVIDDGFISKEEFQLGLLGNNQKNTVIADRIFNLFDFKHDGMIGFEEFIKSLSIFHPDSRQEDKAAFMFQFYDTRQNGYIEREEVKEMVMAMLKESDLILSDNFIDAIVDKTFEEADSRKDGKIDREEWNEFVARNPNLLRIMNIPYLKDISTEFPSFSLRSDVEEMEEDYLQQP